MQDLLSDDLIRHEIVKWLVDPHSVVNMASTNRHWRETIPRPRPWQFVTSSMRFPHSIFLEDAETGEIVNQHVTEPWEQCGRTYRLWTYVKKFQARAYLEPSLLDNGINEDDSHALAVAFQYHHAQDESVGKPAPSSCVWQIERQGNSQLKFYAVGVEGYETCRLVLDLSTSGHEPFLRLDDAIQPQELYHLEDYDSEAPVFLTQKDESDDKHSSLLLAYEFSGHYLRKEWRRRLFHRLPIQPRPHLANIPSTGL